MNKLNKFSLNGIFLK